MSPIGDFITVICGLAAMFFGLAFFATGNSRDLVYGGIAFVLCVVGVGFPNNRL